MSAIAPVNPALDRAYRATSYRVVLGARHVDVRIGQPWIAVQGLLLAGERSAAILTAFNPGSRVLHNHENAARHEQLCLAIRAAGLRSLPTVHIADDGEWLPEHGLLLPGLDAEQALRWAARFEQAAIVYLPPGQPAQLRWTTAQLAHPQHR
jgi:hypothetical protein